MEGHCRASLLQNRCADKPLATVGGSLLSCRVATLIPWAIPPTLSYSVVLLMGLADCTGVACISRALGSPQIGRLGFREARLRVFSTSIGSSIAGNEGGIGAPAALI